ncbi:MULTISPECIES: hypothetical protein [Rhodopseudomonas]|uniref:hypothetical protein n=1 Tax=Rhodopseudomonas TaxID=1073 RepID=UPI001FDA886E|nr:MULTISPECIES: hypothetical protein [Rhodopseudomonas]
MSLFLRYIGQGLLRSSRNALVWAVMTAYLIAGILHGVDHLDLASSKVQVVVAIGDKGDAVPDKADVAGQHCHGCFSVAIAHHVATPLMTDASDPTGMVRVMPRPGERRGIDPPPPKS